MTVEIPDTAGLRLHVCGGDGNAPHLLLERLESGLVKIHAREVKSLVSTLILASGDLARMAAEAVGDEGE